MFNTVIILFNISLIVLFMNAKQMHNSFFLRTVIVTAAINLCIITNVYVSHLIFQEVGLVERLQNQKKQLKAKLRRAEEEKRRLLEEVDNLVKNVEVLINLGKQSLTKE